LLLLICLNSYFVAGNYGKVFKGKYWDNEGREQEVAVKVGKSLFYM